MEALNNKWIWLVLLAVIIAVVLVGKWQGWWTTSGVQLDYVPNEAIPTSNFNAKQEAITLYDSVSVSDWDKTIFKQACERVLSYSNNETIAVHNEYLKKYDNSEYPTLRQLFQSEWTNGWFTWDSDAKTKQTAVLQKLTDLGI